MSNNQGGSGHSIIFYPLKLDLSIPLKGANTDAQWDQDYNRLPIAILPFVSFITYMTLFSRVHCQCHSTKRLHFLVVLVALCDYMTKFWPIISKLNWYEDLIISIKNKRIVAFVLHSLYRYLESKCNGWSSSSHLGL